MRETQGGAERGGGEGREQEQKEQEEQEEQGEKMHEDLIKTWGERVLFHSFTYLLVYLAGTSRDTTTKPTANLNHIRYS